MVVGTVQYLYVLQTFQETEVLKNIRHFERSKIRTNQDYLPEIRQIRTPLLPYSVDLSMR
jgi:hypothetical protein